MDFCTHHGTKFWLFLWLIWYKSNLMHCILCKQMSFNILLNVALQTMCLVSIDTVVKCAVSLFSLSRLFEDDAVAWPLDTAITSASVCWRSGWFLMLIVFHLCAPLPPHCLIGLCCCCIPMTMSWWWMRFLFVLYIQLRTHMCISLQCVCVMLII